MAGGSVRDQLMRKKPKDFDIVTSAKPQQIERLIKKTIPVGKKFGVIITIIDGCAASAATFMSVVGAKRKINANAYMLIHQLSSVAWGKYAELVDDKKNVDEFMRKIKEIYKKYTKVPVKELDKILSHDLWWNAKTCLKYGLVDEII